jgi:hypothetical protein
VIAGSHPRKLAFPPRSGQPSDILSSFDWVSELPGGGERIVDGKSSTGHRGAGAGVAAGTAAGAAGLAGRSHGVQAPGYDQDVTRNATSAGQTGLRDGRTQYSSEVAAGTATAQYGIGNAAPQSGLTSGTTHSGYSTGHGNTGVLSSGNNQAGTLEGGVSGQRIGTVGQGLPEPIDTSYAIPGSQQSIGSQGRTQL